MPQILLLTALLAACIVAGWIVDRVRRATHTKQVRALGFPLAWVPLVPRGLSVYSTVPMDLRERLQLKAFEKITDLHFDGVGPYEELSDAIRVSLGCHLGLLHANVRIPPIPAIRSVVVGTEQEIHDGLSALPPTWPQSTLVTIWDPTAQAARNAREELDEPLMQSWRTLSAGAATGPAQNQLFFAGWARSLMLDAADQLPASLAKAPALEDNPTLFAAASECFIRHPKSLREKEPGLYEALVLFYKFDPVHWTTR